MHGYDCFAYYCHYYSLMVIFHINLCQTVPVGSRIEPLGISQEVFTSQMSFLPPNHHH